MKKILVTGGAGYIGSHMVVALVEAGYAPVVLDSLINSDSEVFTGLQAITGQSIPFIAADCRDEAAVAKIFSDHDVQGVIHFAALKSVGESVSKPLLYYDNNIGSLLSLLRCMVAAGVPSLVFSSSCTVYGDPDQVPVTEETPFKGATSPYGATKQLGERIITDVVGSGAELQAIMLRYFNPIGAHPSGLIGEKPRGEPQNVLPVIMKSLEPHAPAFKIYGTDYPTDDGTCVRDYIHVMDLAVAHVRALEAVESFGPRSEARVYNVGTGRGTSVLELLDTFRRATGVPVPYEVGPRRPGDIVKTYADVAKAEEQLHWKSRYSLEEALRDAWRWHAHARK